METAPPAMKCEPLYRLMGFVIDKHFRGKVSAERYLRWQSQRYMRISEKDLSSWDVARITIQPQNSISGMDSENLIYGVQ